MYIAIKEKWDAKNNNPLDLDEALFKQKTYAPYWHLFTVSLLLCNINKQSDMIPAPDAAMRIFKEKEILYVSKLKEKLKMSKCDFSPVWRLE